MRNRQLRDALAAFSEEAAWQLASDTADGHELAFEVIESGGRRRDATLYCYRPLTADFIDRRRSVIAQLPAYLPAVHALAAVGGLDAYLEARIAVGVPRDARERAELALRAFLCRVFEDSTDFVLQNDRFTRAYEELESVVHEGRTETVVVAPLLGLTLQSSEMPMGDGLTLMRADVLEDGPADVLRSRSSDEEPRTLVVLRWEAAAGDPAPFEHARVRLARLVGALRLYDASNAALGPIAWTRTAGGPWQVVSLADGASGHSSSDCAISTDQEDELRAFCHLVSRRTPRSGELAWALHRFELGCSREDPHDALTDHLLALRALLEPEGVASGHLPGRLAALCAQPADRLALTERLAHITGLERALISGVGLPEADSLAALSDEIAGYLRDILRDILCGHLDPDVRGIADALIAGDFSQESSAAQA